MRKILNENMPSVVGNINSNGIRKQYKDIISEFLFKNRWPLLLCFTVIISGGILGGIIYTYLSQESKNQIFSYMQNYFMGSVIVGASQAEIFKKIFFDYVLTAVIMMISGILYFLYPLSFIRLFSKGISMGFSITFLISRYGAKGVIFSLSSVLLCNIFIICAMIWFILSISELRKNPTNEHSSKFIFRFMPHNKDFLRLIFCFIIFILASLISALFEGYIGHGLLVGLYSIFTT